MIRKQRLKDYRFWALDATFVVAAMAMSTLTVGALVVLPEHLESEEQASAFRIAARSVDGSCTMEHTDPVGAESN